MFIGCLSKGERALAAPRQSGVGCWRGFLDGYFAVPDGAQIVVVMDGPFGGEHAPSRAFSQSFFDTFPEMVFTVGTMKAEDDRVAVEVTSRGVMRGGAPYRNHYHNLFVIDGDKIRLFKEYPTGYTGD